MASTSAADCIFCKIIAGQIPSPRIFENERFICIRDIRPQAKVHVLVVPKEHIVSLETAYPNDGADKHSVLIGEMFQVATQIARQEKLLPGGFRTVINTGKDGGQTDWHLHLHELGGGMLHDEFG
jgi:histidine triad (HIT) family protein